MFLCGETRISGVAFGGAGDDDDAGVAPSSSEVPPGGHDHPSFSTAFVTVVNFVMGTGILAIPHAFFVCGLATGIGATVLMTLLSMLTHGFLVEGQFRVAVLRDALHLGYVNKQAVQTLTEQDDDREVNEAAKLIDDNASKAINGPATHQADGAGEGDVVHHHSVLPEARTLERSTTHTDGSCDGHVAQFGFSSSFGHLDARSVVEVGEMACIFGGRPLEAVWTLSSILYVFTALWLYVVVWASSVVLLVPLTGWTRSRECNIDVNGQFGGRCPDAMKVFICVFFVLQGVMLLNNWSWVRPVQKVLTALSYVILLLIASLCTAGMFHRSYPGAAHQGSHSPYVQPSETFSFTAFSELFGVMIFSQLGQQGNAVTMRCLSDPTQTKRVYLAAFSTICFLYALLGVTTSQYFGDRTDKVVTLNFDHYAQWGVSGGMGSFLGSLVVAYPALSVFAAYYQNCAGLIEILEGWSPMAARVRFAALFGVEYKVGQLLPLQLLLRLLVLTGSVGLCFVTYRFSLVLSICGTVGFFLFFFVPCAIQVMSQVHLRRLGLPTTTPVDSRLTSPPALAGVVSLIALAAMGYYIQSQLIPSFQHG